MKEMGPSPAFVTDVMNSTYTGFMTTKKEVELCLLILFISKGLLNLKVKVIYILHPNHTGEGGVFHPPHGFLIAISLFYEKLSQNSLIFSFYMFTTYFWKKISKW